MSSVPYSKRNSFERSSVHSFEYEQLEEQVKFLVDKKDKAESYYTQRAGEIELSWLDESVLDADRNYIWTANMPIPFWLSKKVYESSKKMARNSVMSLVFPDYDLDANEMSLFDVLFEYGRARGMEVVCEQLYLGAQIGDPRAVKMYLEMMGVLDSELSEDEKLKKLTRFSFNMISDQR